MTLRQKMLLKELPKNKYILSKAAIKVGYSESYARTDLSTQLRKSKPFQEKLKALYSEDGIKKEQATALKDFKKAKDNTNRQRAIEFMGKISGLIVDKAEVTNIDKEDNQFSLDRLSRIKQAEN